VRFFVADNVFWPLKTKCFDLKAGQYTYKMCPYESAKQDSTSLGNWQGFSDDHSSMEFTGGQHCWNGPNRSCKVVLQCGTEDKILSIDETSTCVYEMVFTTPAACTEELQAAKRDEL
jgi:protein kinase C substrate 80K-H